MSTVFICLNKETASKNKLIGMLSVLLSSKMSAEGFVKGHAEGFVEGECTTVYAIVQDGDISPEKGAKRLNITVEELRSRMTLTGYKWPEQK